MSKLVKGEYGYIKKKKASQLKKTILMFSIGAMILLLGLLLNKWEKANVFTIVAALMVLPATRYLVGYIVLFPYHSVAKDAFDKVSKVVSDSSNLLTDVVLTSEEKVMSLSFLVLHGKSVIGLSGREKENAKQIETYLNHRLSIMGYQVKVTIYDNDAKFLKACSIKSLESFSSEEQSSLMSFFKSQMI